MRQFVEEKVEKPNHVKSLTIALEGKKPFRQFRTWVENCRLLDEWYAFRQEKLEEYVREQLGFLMRNS